MKFASQIIKFIVCLLITVVISSAQSTSQLFPTPVTTSEIVGSIPARDIGDARLTTYFYGFEGEQGDIFVNLVTKNFTGDIDVFMVSGLRSLTKIVVYADLAENETGRVLYLRKPEKLLLRVQGRSPNDDPATFRIKFAGSFVASKDSTGAGELELPKVVTENESGIRVNSVGTIIEVIPKPTPSPKADVAEKAIVETEVAAVEKTDAEVSDKKPPVTEDTEKKELEVVVSDSLPPSNPATVNKRTRPRVSRARTKRPPKTKPAVEKTAPKEAEQAETETVAKAEPKKKREPKEKLPDPLENIRLIILFKDGKVIERPMSEVFRFSVDKGVLTVTSKDGSIGRYSILDVAKVTIE